MSTVLINPYMSFPPSSVAIDDFIGTNGGAISTAIWDHNGNTTHGALREIQSNSLHMSTGNIGGNNSSDSNGIFTDATYADAEIQFLDFEWLSTTVDQAFTIKLMVRASGTMADWQADMPDGIGMEIKPGDHEVFLFSKVADGWSGLSSSVSFTTLVGGNPVAGDKWNIVFRHTGTAFQAFIWKTTGSRPGTPSLSAATTSFTSAGKVSIGCGGNTVASRAFRIGSVVKAA